MKILTINPGSTSTKIAVFDDLKPVMIETIKHSVEDLAPYKKVSDQFEYRRDLVLKTLAEKNHQLDFDAIVSRGGLLDRKSVV